MVGLTNYRVLSLMVMQIVLDLPLREPHHLLLFQILLSQVDTLPLIVVDFLLHIVLSLKVALLNLVNFSRHLGYYLFVVVLQ